MAKTIQIDDEVRDILSRSAIDADSLKLPDKQLERPLYERVDKIIKAAGGKWSKSRKAHLFQVDPREALGLAMESGKIENRQQAFQEFFTPAELAKQLCENVEPRDRVLEPSAGIGRIAKAAADQGGQVFCCELQPSSVAKLREDHRLCVWEGDFLSFHSMWLRPFDHVVMNPPFSDGQEYEHVRHAFDFLKDGGTLVSVMSPGMKFKQQKRDKEFREWLAQFRHETEDLPSGTFKESGTGVETILLRVWK